MKKILFLFLLASMQNANSQTRFTYQATSDGVKFGMKFIIEVSEDSVIKSYSETAEGKPAEGLYKYYDLKTGLRIHDYVNDRFAGDVGQFTLEEIDSLICNAVEKKVLATNVKVGNYTCTKYDLNFSRFTRGGLYGASTLEYTYHMVMYIDESQTKYKDLSKYITNNVGLRSGCYTCYLETEGLMVKMDYEMKKKNKMISEGSIVLRKIETGVKSIAKFQMPWERPKVKPSVYDWSDYGKSTTFFYYKDTESAQHYKARMAELLSRYTSIKPRFAAQFMRSVIE